MSRRRNENTETYCFFTYTYKNSSLENVSAVYLQSRQECLLPQEHLADKKSGGQFQGKERLPTSQLVPASWTSEIN